MNLKDKVPSEYFYYKLKQSKSCQGKTKNQETSNPTSQKNVVLYVHIVDLKSNKSRTSKSKLKIQQ